jgi:hypothetical protein
MWFTDLGAAIGRITTRVTPRIRDFRPATGPVGTQVTIRGAGLSDTTLVAFNGTPGAVISNTASEVVAELPPGATTGPIAVTTPYGTVTTSTPFSVT